MSIYNDEKDKARRLIEVTDGEYKKKTDIGGSAVSKYNVYSNFLSIKDTMLNIERILSGDLDSSSDEYIQTMYLSMYHLDSYNDSMDDIRPIVRTGYGGYYKL